MSGVGRRGKRSTLCESRFDRGSTADLGVSYLGRGGHHGGRLGSDTKKRKI